MGAQPLRSPCWAAASSGPRSCACCTSRPTTWPRASGAPSSWSASPYADLDAHARRRASPRALLTTDADGAGRPRRRRRRRRGDRRHRARPDADPRRAGERRSRWSPPTRRCSPRTAPTLFDGGRDGRRRPLLRGRGRRRHPARCARCASRWPATASAGCSASSTAPPTTSSTRWTRRGAGFAEALDEAQALGYAEADPTADVEGFDAAAKAAILASARLPHPGDRRRRPPRGHHRGHRRRRRLGPRHGQRRQAARDLRAQPTTARASPCACTRR